MVFLPENSGHLCSYISLICHLGLFTTQLLQKAFCHCVPAVLYILAYRSVYGQVFSNSFTVQWTGTIWVAVILHIHFQMNYHMPGAKLASNLCPVLVKCLYTCISIILSLHLSVRKTIPLIMLKCLNHEDLFITVDMLG